MATVIGVRFKKAGKVYYFDPGELWPRAGEAVIVETARGVEYGEVVNSARNVSDDQLVSPLKKVVRMATAADTAIAENNARREAEAFRICREKIRKHKLDMKLVSVEFTFDGSHIIFYFTADGRVDFRELVRDLAGVFHMRIELRQIGVRDEARMLGGIGACGRPICCGTFLGDFQPVSIKMAKEQNLSLNPTKISGICGRLMCCLKYEEDTYERTHKRVPRVGKDIVTPDGTGVICEINAIRETVRVRLRNADDTYDVREYAMDDVRRLGPDDAPAVREAPRSDRRRPAPAAQEAQNAENGEEPKKKRYPHQKAPKNLSTDQFLEQLSARKPEAGESAPTEEQAPNAEGKRHRRRSKGKRGDEAAREQQNVTPNAASTESAPGQAKRQPSDSRTEPAPKRPATDEKKPAVADRPIEVDRSTATERPIDEAKPVAAERPIEAVKPETTERPTAEVKPMATEKPITEVKSDAAAKPAEAPVPPTAE